MLQYHTSVTSGLQCVARLARRSPLVVVLDVPVAKAVAVAHRQLDRYPSISATHVTRSALRAAGMPAVQLVVMPPTNGQVVMLLLTNQIPTDFREQWRNAFEPAPVVWRNYELCHTSHGSVSWRLSADARLRYRQHIARLIAGRGPTAWGRRPYQLSDATAQIQLQRLQRHLYLYPGLAGVRTDIHSLWRYARAVWMSTRAHGRWDVWPYQPYVRYRAPQTRPLAEIHQLRRD